METTELPVWLFQHAGIVIRHQLSQMFPSHGFRVGRQQLLTSHLVERWLNQLQPHTSFNAIHGGAPTTFENAAGKLSQLGLRPGFWALDERMQPHLQWFCSQPVEPRKGHYSETSSWSRKPFLRMISGAGLVACSYGQEPAVRRWAEEHIQLLYDFTR